jgi:phosphoenolpyruvate-protein kinase (PTS system EI component)
MTTVIAAIAACVALVIAALVCVVKARGAKLKTAVARADKAERESAAYRQAFATAEARATRLKQALEENIAVEEEANEERQELAATPNTELVRRANHLFGGV